jgi:Tfp pilus assembly protein FimT
VRARAVWISALDGSHERLVHTGYAPAFSSRGDLVIEDRNGRIDIVDPRTGGVLRAVATGEEPTWSPDGSTIAYSRDGDIWAVGRDGSGAHRITSGPVPDRWPAYSPDGTRIAYRAVPADGLGIFTADATDGGNVVRITRAGREPVWSPDGTKILYDEPGALRIVDAADGANGHEFSISNGWSGEPDWR